METKKQAGFAQRARKVVTGNPIVFLLLIAAIVVGCLKDNFFSWANFSNLVSNTAIRFLIALGVSGCLITKGTDLSAGRQVGFAAVVAGIMCQRGDYNGRLWKFLPEMSIGLVFLVVVVIGLIWGLINGLIVTKLHVPPFIATLGTQPIIYGISNLFFCWMCMCICLFPCPSLGIPFHPYAVFINVGIMGDIGLRFFDGSI